VGKLGENEERRTEYEIRGSNVGWPYSRVAGDSANHGYGCGRRTRGRERVRANASECVVGDKGDWEELRHGETVAYVLRSSCVRAATLGVITTDQSLIHHVARLSQVPLLPVGRRMAPQGPVQGPFKPRVP
jgi:hypothetical protein